MANRWIDYVYQQTDYRRGELAVAHKLADAANGQTDICWLKIETIAAATRLSPRHVKRILKALETDGFLQITRYYGRGHQPAFKLQKVTSTTPFKDRQKVTSMPLKGDISDTEKVTLEASSIYKDEPLREPFLEPEEGLIPTTQKIVGISVDLYTQQQIQDIVPEGFEEYWFKLLRLKMIGMQNTARNHLARSLGYWLTDFDNNLWRYRKDEEAKNGTDQKSYRQERADAAVEERNFYDGLRRELERTDTRLLLETNGPDC